MKNRHPGWTHWLGAAWLVVTVGCGSSERSANSASTGDERSDSASEAAEHGDSSADSERAAQRFKLGDLIEPFDPPTLEELEQSVQWIDSPVVDPLERLRAAKGQEPPLVTVDEALALRNDSPDANRKIYSALSAVAPPNGEGVNSDATFNRALLLDLRSMNPLLSSSVAEIEIAKLTSFNMFGYDWNMIPFALTSCVVSWQTSADHLYDKIVMRGDLTWSDGQPITARDVAFSFKLIMTSSVPVPSQRTGTDEIRWIEAYDDHTLVYFHKRALATNVWNLNFYVIPKHIYEKSVHVDPTLRTSAYHRQLERNPISGNAYSVARWSRGHELVLQRREDYYLHDGRQVRDEPYFAQIRFRIIEDGNTRLLALKSGDIEESELEAEQWHTQTAGPDFYRENTKVNGPEWLYFYIGWNLDTNRAPFFSDARVRKALAYALNYEEMLDDLCYGLFDPCTGPFHPDSWMYPKAPLQPYRQDLDKAEDLLDEAGWVDTDHDGIRDKEINGRRVPFEFSLLVSNKPDRIAICNLFRENVESIGIVCNIVPLEAAVFQERVFEKNFEAAFAGWGTSADPSLAKNVFGTGEARNFGAYSNPEVDRLFDAAMNEFDREKQAGLYGRIQELIFEDQPYLFLYNKHSLYGFSKKLRGYRFSPRGPFHYSPGIDSIWSP